MAVVQGGPSSEAEVSRASAASVVQALCTAGHDVVPLELDASLHEALRAGGFDVVFPVVHGAVGEDGCLQGMLEILALPYVGSAVLASAAAMDKAFARKVFAAAGLPVAHGLAAQRGDALAEAVRCRHVLGRALVVKPARSGSALGVARLDEDASDASVASALEAAWSLDAVAVVEHFARGREVTCSVLDLEVAARALAATEIVTPQDAFYTYNARYAPGRSRHTCPAELAQGTTRRVYEVAVAAHRSLGCRDLSRVDFVVGDGADQGAVTLLEVNTMPGFTKASLFPEAATAAGIAFPALCDRLVQHANARGAPRRNAAVPFPV